MTAKDNSSIFNIKDVLGVMARVHVSEGGGRIVQVWSKDAGAWVDVPDHEDGADLTLEDLMRARDATAAQMVAQGVPESAIDESQDMARAHSHDMARAAQSESAGEGESNVVSAPRFAGGAYRVGGAALPLRTDAIGSHATSEAVRLGIKGSSVLTG